MRNEAEFKRIFKKSVVAHRGYVISLAASSMSGVPDLYCVVPGYIPILLEAKFLGKDNRVNTFTNKIKYRPAQLHYMKHINAACKYSIWGIVGFKYMNKWYCCLLPYGVERVTYKFMETSHWTNYDPKTKLFDIDRLFKNTEIPRIPDTSTFIPKKSAWDEEPPEFWGELNVKQDV